MCRICEKELESYVCVLLGCLLLMYFKYVNNKNVVLKVLFFEVLRDVKFVDYVYLWYLWMEFKLMYELNDV